MRPTPQNKSNMYLSTNTLLQGGKYKIVRHISSGGFGNTYEGIHTMMDTRVAIKEFFPKTFCNRDDNTSHVTVATQGNRDLVDKLRKKFNEEARAVFQMKHDNIVRVVDIFEENGTAYYVMEYIDGRSLNDIVKERGVLSEAEAVGYIRQIADALKYVHSLNRLHLDVKPGNIIVDNSGKAILIDFGASKHYDDETGENNSTLMGVNTPGYAPIEQCTQSFTVFSPATDIYALGATLYKLLTGITPPDANQLLGEEAFLQPLSASISAPTRKAVHAAMALKRKDRPQSIDEFCALLDSREDDDQERTLLKEEEPTRIEKKVMTDVTTNQASGSKPNVLYGLIAVVIVGAIVGWFAFGRSPKAPVSQDVAESDTIAADSMVQEPLADTVAVEPIVPSVAAPTPDPATKPASQPVRTQTTAPKQNQAPKSSATPAPTPSITPQSKYSTRESSKPASPSNGVPSSQPHTVQTQPSKPATNTGISKQNDY